MEQATRDDMIAYQAEVLALFRTRTFGRSARASAATINVFYAVGVLVPAAAPAAPVIPIVPAAVPATGGVKRY